MTKVRTGPDCASTGLAQDAFAGVKHSAAFSRLAQRRIAAGPDRQRPELAEGEATVRAGAGHVLDPVQPGVPVRIGGFLPGPGPLERDAALVKELPQPLPPDPHRPARAR
jgi:hypothetical protein